MRLYIIRHADPDYENNTITTAGHLEAQALARRLAQHGLDYIYTSPLGRARDTMKYTFDLLKIQPVVLDWTQEIAEYLVEYGPWGKLMAWDIPGEVIRGGKAVPVHNDWHHSPPFNAPIVQEKFEMVRRESDGLLMKHGYERRGGKYASIKPNRDRIAVFCHAGLGLTWLAHLLEIPLTLMWSGFWMAPSSVTTVLFDERSGEWAVPRVLSHGDVSHLYEARLPVQPRGIKANYH